MYYFVISRTQIFPVTHYAPFQQYSVFFQTGLRKKPCLDMHCYTDGGMLFSFTRKFCRMEQHADVDLVSVQRLPTAQFQPLWYWWSGTDSCFLQLCPLAFPFLDWPQDGKLKSLSTPCNSSCFLDMVSSGYFHVIQVFVFTTDCSSLFCILISLTRFGPLAILQYCLLSFPWAYGVFFN